jgi:UDP:flavonoid glycosyltransferase YjiC (YdhE family)
MLVVPYGWDQPDNAARVARLGTGLHVPRKEYSVKTAVKALRRLLDEAKFETRAAEVANQMSKEDGLAIACNAIEALL